MELLTCDDFAIGYDQKIVVDNLSFKVDEGDYLCIVGENGAGKSTLVKTLLRLQEPIRGSLKVSNDLKANEVGYLPQQTIVQRDFPATVEEIVLSGCQGRTGLRPFYNRQEKNLAEKNMEKMRIRDLAKRSYRDLSGGQQ
ncbi:MAG: ATP-binding cassette domain-containing protein, partial [Clostridiales bacterium]|nr:ATP-binding cassette domain-containing protein [Clostridiales bacterium]